MADNQHDMRPQPNLALCSQSLHNLAREAEKFQNLPAFDASNQLSLAVNRLTQLVNEKFDALNEKFDGMKTQISVNDSNSVARVQNAALTKATDTLSPMVSPVTNAPIQGFPRTSEEIRNMSVRTLTSVLEGLGLPAGGNADEKKRRLRSYIGLRPDPA